MKRAPGGAWWLLLSCAMLYSSSAFAEVRRIVVLAPADEPEGSVTELLARLRGELTASGLEVIVAAAPVGVDLRDAVESSALELSPVAVVGVRFVPGSAAERSTLEVWVSDRRSSQTLVQRATLDPTRKNQPARLAVQVSELFKVPLALQPEEPASAPTAPPTPPARSEPAPEPEIVEVESSLPAARSPSVFFGAGVGVVHQFTDLSPAWFPAITLGVEVARSGVVGFALGATGALTPNQTQIEHELGRARVGQAWGLAQAYLWLFPRAVVHPSLSLGAGVYRVDVDGEAEGFDRAYRVHTWSSAASMGLGLRVEPSPHLTISLEGQTLLAWAKTVVRIHERPVGSFGSPSGLVSLNLFGRY